MDARPLYERVRDGLIERLTSGVWRPGDCLPSEMALAAEFGVSQGTLRKAVDSLAADGVLARRQGLGTFVAETTEERSNYYFFRFVGRDGARLTPTPVSERVRRRRARAQEAAALGLAAKAEVFVIERLRAVDGRPALCETSVVSAALAPDLASPLPNALYPFYERACGVSVVRAEETIRAEPACAEDAKRLGVAPGAPLLTVERTAYDLAGRPVELRRTRALTESAAYSVSLR